MENNQYNPNNYNQYNYGTGQQLPPYNNPNSGKPFDPNEVPMTLKDWILTFLLLLIPFANLVFPFVWAFGNNVNKSKKTFFQAYLIFMLASIVLYILLIIALISLSAFTAFNLSDTYY